MADDTDAGLSVRQLLKMVASGDLRAVLYVFGKPDFHIWSRLREFGAHIPDPDLESFKTRLRDILIRCGLPPRFWYHFLSNKESVCKHIH